MKGMPVLPAVKPGSIARRAGQDVVACDIIYIVHSIV